MRPVPESGTIRTAVWTPPNNGGDPRKVAAPGIEPRTSGHPQRQHIELPPDIIRYRGGYIGSLPGGKLYTLGILVVWTCSRWSPPVSTPGGQG